MNDHLEPFYEDQIEVEEYEELDFTFSDTALSDGQLDTLYQRGRFRLIQERNDFMLPQILDYVKKDQWINTQPAYQRRLRWNRRKKSALIESFLMNVPVPPVFLYERDINRYEVMDGQQRINSIVEFYNNEFRLVGLKTWPALNGKNYSQLPPKMRRGLDRAKLSAHILLADAEDQNDKVDDIRTLVFDRLNTGGEKLNAQELRNALYSGPFAEMLVEISSDERFTNIWKIPRHDENTDEDGTPNDHLRSNALFKSMKDCEIVLRFFAFRDDDKIAGSVRKILDNCAKEYRRIDKDTVENLKQEYFRCLDTAVEIFADDIFLLPANQMGRRILSRPLYDAIMVALSRLGDDKDQLASKANEVKAALTENLEDPDVYNLIVGRANTSDAVKERIRTVFGIFSDKLQ